ncbi:MAG: alpha/beta hydrolase-fold protein [Woeseia sp.]
MLIKKLGVRDRIALVLLALLASSVHADELRTLPAGSSQFTFSGWAGPDLEVRVYAPDTVKDTTPIVMVMHGASRTADNYFTHWQLQGQAHGFVVVVPEFNAVDFPGSWRYNLGHVFDKDTGRLRPESQWTFSAIEPLFDQITAALGTDQTAYTLYGHSAGAQFVHRFLYYKPDARVARAIAANAGWYTLPDFEVAYPYGLDGANIRDSVIREALGKDVILLLGDADIDTEQDNLRKTPEAQQQGPHRYARGATMYNVARSTAEHFGVKFNWRKVDVPGAAHSNAQMTPAAAGLVD